MEGPVTSVSKLSAAGRQDISTPDLSLRGVRNGTGGGRGTCINRRVTGTFVEAYRVQNQSYKEKMKWDKV